MAHFILLCCKLSIKMNDGIIRMKRTKYVFDSIVIWIEKNIKEDIDVNDIVSKSGYSKRNVQYLFKKFLGYGIHTYVKNRRLSLSAKLLKVTKMPIIEICSIYHFGSYQSFNRAFKIKFGIPPARYRRAENWLLSRYTGNAAIERPNIISRPVLLPCLEVMSTSKEFKVNFSDGNYNNGNDEGNIAEIKRYVRTLVLHNKNAKKSKLMIIYRIAVCAKSNITLNVTVFEVKDAPNDASLQRQTIGAGMYYLFHYEGTWREYNSLSDYVYLNELPMLNMNRRNAFDIEIYDIRAMREKTKLKVDLYVPVSPEITGK
ncbi:TPA: helix-turn-helix domain-containing protein [Salmonella enterica]|uniref:Helix-turn-helix domain-containing protein n=1 Tax=Salmonella enterica TaxID=28901 RepID=A0A747DPT2_SALER|nr:helix-turn-helix domain-containing protein [Salmonella enterica]HAF4391223.1 helix-turn-helix domain-containing protein [Salmonella enterica]HAF6182511.1 helix-turn-helix domain-containing protein [Salmonella enterica]